MPSPRPATRWEITIELEQPAAWDNLIHASGWAAVVISSVAAANAAVPCLPGGAIIMGDPLSELPGS